MKKPNRKAPNSLEAAQSTESDRAREDQSSNDQAMVEQIIGKATGATPYESDNTAVRASMLEASGEPRIVDPLAESDGNNIAPSKSPTFTSGGGGFDYEDFVAAYYLAMMLLDRRPLGNEFGGIQSVLWQAGDIGWLFDDVVVCGDSESQAGISVKTDAHVNSNGFSTDFVKRAWAQYKSTCGRTFASDDLICLAELTISTEVQTAWRLLSGQVEVANLDRLVSRLETGEDEKNPQSSVFQRKIVQSLIEKCDLTPKPTIREALQLLKSIRVLPFDFLLQPSRDEDRAIQSLQYAVERGERDDAITLWKELLLVSKSMRANGGNIDRDELAARLKQKNVALRSLPNHERPLEKWRQHSARRLETASWGVHGDVKPLERPELWGSLADLERSLAPMVFVGASGSGKTSLAKEIGSREDRRCYLLDDAICSAGGMMQNGLFVGSSNSISDLLKAENHDCLLLIDACEKFEDEHLDVVLSSIAELGSDVSHRLRIIFTCLSSKVGSIEVALHRFGIQSNTIAVPNPTPREVLRLLSDDTTSFKIEDKPRLQEILTNLKVLDLFVRAIDSGVALNDAGDMNASRLFDFLWNDWINRGQHNPERGRLLQKVALECSRRLVQAVPILELESHEATLLEGLRNDGLVNCDEKVFFTHDFVRDLARSRILLGQSINEIVAKSTSYPWHGAIRLYAQRLAENDFKEWCEHLSAVSRETDGWHICHSILVEGLVQAAEVRPQLVARIWNEFGDGDLQMLLRQKFLERVLDAAPVDERWSGRVSGGSISGAGPWRKYDSAVIEEVFVIAGNELPEAVELQKLLMLVCEMIFRRRLSGEKLTDEHVSNVTNVALAVADSVVSRERVLGRDSSFRKCVYRSLLLSVMVSPKRATELILLAAERCPRLVEEVEVEEIELDREALGIGLAPILFDEAEIVEVGPWPHGPLDRVGDDFRKVCLESDLLLPLIALDPEKAKEVLFACTIEHPQSRSASYHSSDTETGLVDYYTTVDPFYDVGPFLQFFQINPELAFDFIVTITNFAAENWSISRHREDLDTRAFDRYGSRLGPFEFNVPDSSSEETNTWKGNGNIFCWSVGGLPINKTVTSALMAFEFWVYRSLDAGKNIDQLLITAVAESRNAGMAGCLIDIGKKYPKLFLGPLRELLGCWAFYAWDAAKILENTSTPPLMIGRGMTSSPHRVKLAADWLKQPHRKNDLIRIAASLLVRDESFRDFIEECRQRWTTEAAERFSVHQLKHLLSVFDWNNYKIEDQDDGSQLVSYQPPDDLLQDAISISAELENKQLLLTFPFQCRQLMKQDQPLDVDQFNWVWSSVQKIAALPVEEADGEDPLDDTSIRPVNCIAAGVALLLTLGKDHFNEEVFQFCRDRFESLITDPPRRNSFDMPESPVEYSWDYSLVDMTFAYLDEEPNDEATRYGISHCLTAFHYQTVEHLVNLARKSRTKFPTLFRLLPKYISRLSALREILRRIGNELGRAESCYQQWKETGGNGHYEGINRLESLREAYASQMETFHGFANSVASLEELDVSWQTLVDQSVRELKQMSKNLGAALHFKNRDDNTRSVGHLDIGIDMDVVKHGFNWIELSAATDSAELQSWVEEIKGLIELRRMTVPKLEEGQEFRHWDYGHKFDTFVMSLVSRNVIGAIDSDTSECWKPMLDDISVAPKFVDDFLNHINALVYDAKSNPKHFVCLWSAMIEYVLASKAWADKDVPPEQWVSLLGMSFTAQFHTPEIDPAWSNSVSMEIAKRSRVFTEAIEFAIQSSFVCAGVVKHFAQPIWRSLRLEILEKLAESPLVRLEETFFPADDIAKLLSLCWADHSSQIIKQPKVEKAFQLLLSKSIQAGSAAAKELGQIVGMVKI